jgi:hypothetical protein
LLYLNISGCMDRMLNVIGKAMSKSAAAGKVCPTGRLADGLHSKQGCSS